MYVVCVRFEVLPDKIDAFIAATLVNARETRKEPGNLRFDLLQGIDDSTQFFLYEVYRDEKEFQFHLKTPQYLSWNAQVDSFLKVPFVAQKHTNIFPDPWV